jgi:hypothetical protein
MDGGCHGQRPFRPLASIAESGGCVGQMAGPRGIDKGNRFFPLGASATIDAEFGVGGNRHMCSACPDTNLRRWRSIFVRLALEAADRGQIPGALKSIDNPLHSRLGDVPPGCFGCSFGP